MAETVRPLPLRRARPRPQAPRLQPAAALRPASPLLQPGRPPPLAPRSAPSSWPPARPLPKRPTPLSSLSSPLRRPPQQPPPPQCRPPCPRARGSRALAAAHRPPLATPPPPHILPSSWPTSSARASCDRLNQRRSGPTRLWGQAECTCPTFAPRSYFAATPLWYAALATCTLL